VTQKKFFHNKLREGIVGGNKEHVNIIFVIQRICETAAEKEAIRNPYHYPHLRLRRLDVAARRRTLRMSERSSDCQAVLI
jgi:hypothetical protein